MIRNENGQITVFLSMTFFVFLGLCFCVLEGIHGYMESALAEEAFEEAGNEILANYDKYIFSKYHVFFLDPRERNHIKKDTMNFLNHYETSGTYGFHCKNLSLTEEKTAVDERGLFLRYQISEYMKYYNAAQTGDELKQLIKSFCREVEEAGSREKDFHVQDEEPVSFPEDETSSESPDVWTQEEGTGEKEAADTNPKAAEYRLTWSGLREILNQAVNSGILLYAADQPERLSSASVETAGLPSGGSGHEASGREEKEGFSWNRLSEWRDFLNAGYFNGTDVIDLKRDKKLMDYLFLCFCHYGSPGQEEQTALEYELEYLIAGKRKDRDNLRYVADRIMMFRFLVNYRYASHSAELQAEAEAMAECLTGTLGFSSGKDAVKVLLTAAISYGESLLELHALMKGERIACIKDASNWNLSFENAASKLRNKSSVITVNDGIGYEDCLKLFLYLKCSKKQFIYRMMDIMQLNTALHEQGFKMSDSLYSFKWTGTMKCSRWFVNLPGINSGPEQVFEVKLVKHVGY